MKRKSDNIERVGWYSIFINIFLTLLNLILLLASGSLAVAAEMVHNLVDLMASIAVLVGLKLAKRESRDFPYGLYKVENLVAVGIALLIFIAGYEIAREALFGQEGETLVNLWILGGVLLSMIIPISFSVYEMRVGRSANSPSLIADAHEYKVHFYSSGIVFFALIGQWAGLPLDRIAAVLVVVLVANTGWKLLKDGMSVLLDASLDKETLRRARHAIEAQPAVVDIKSLTGRNAGRYRFLETEVGLRVNSLEKAHQVSQEIEDAIRREIPHVERVLVHFEPEEKTVFRVALPVEGSGDGLHPDFGGAPQFAFVDVRLRDGEILRRETSLNPHR
ncbi:MAG: cation diffusion facilitator family transporter, partial [Planctomycetota bacterium]